MALAITLRGMTLGELRKGREKQLVSKEALLGLLNGTLVGITAGIGMFVYATVNHHAAAPILWIPPRRLAHDHAEPMRVC